MNKRYFTKTIEFFRPFWKPILIVLGFMAIDLCLGLLHPYLFGKSTDALLARDARSTLIFIASGAVIFFLQHQLLLFFRENIEIEYVDTDTSKHMANISLKKMLTFSIGQHNNENSGVKQHIVTKGESALQETVFQMMYEVLPLAIRLIVTTIVLCFMNIYIGIFIILMIIGYLFTTYKANNIFISRLNILRDRRQENAKLSSEIYRNLPVVIIESQEEKMRKQYDSEYESINVYEKSLWRDWNKTLLTNRFFITIGQWGGLGLAAYFIFAGNIRAGIFVTLFVWLQNLFGSLYQVGRLHRRFMILVSQIKKYFDLLDIEPEIKNAKNAVKINDLVGKIEFKNVSFAYPSREKVLGVEAEEEADKAGEATISNISFTVEAGQTVGIVGQSGSGKTTVVNLFRRYHDPIEGEIYVDGVELKSIDLESLRTQVGNVEQEVSLFDTTIKDNITFGLNSQEKVTKEDLDRVTTMASIHDFIVSLKDGYNTMIGEKGIKLSGGERQRVAIARALMKNPKILIFDEATSALDSNNEKIVHEAIKKSAKGRTTIIIAHRLSTVKEADKILVMSKGKLVAEGTHEELMKSSPDYQNLVKKQVF